MGSEILHFIGFQSLGYIALIQAWQLEYLIYIIHFIQMALYFSLYHFVN